MPLIWCEQEQGRSQTVVPKREMSSRCVRRKPLYDNCRLLAPDGTLLSTVDHRKIQWYLARELGCELTSQSLLAAMYCILY